MSGFDLSNFLASFFDEARERLSSINQGLVNFESGTLDDEGLVALRRDAHTIKGSALMLGVNDVGGIAHLFEDAMEYLIQNPQYRTAVMTQFLYDLHDQLAERFEDPDSDFKLDPETARNRYKELLQAIDSGEADTGTLQEETAVVEEVTAEAVTTPEELPEEMEPVTDLEPSLEGNGVEELSIPSAEQELDTEAEPEIDLSVEVAAEEGGETGLELSTEEQMPVADDEDKGIEAADLDLDSLGEGLDFGDFGDLEFAVEEDEESVSAAAMPEDSEEKSEIVSVATAPEELEDIADISLDFGLGAEEESIAESTELSAAIESPIEEEPLKTKDAMETAELTPEAVEDVADISLDFDIGLEESVVTEAPEEVAKEIEAAETAETMAKEKPVEEVSLADKLAAMPQGMIGADEAAEWKQKAKEPEAKPVAEAVTEPSLVEETAAKVSPKEGDSGIDDLDNFRPDVSKMELKSTGRRKSSGRFLRVDAERLEDLSNHIIELTTEQSRNESVEDDFQALYLELRALRREWRGMKESLVVMSQTEREEAMDRLDSSFDRQLRSARYFVEALRYGQTRSSIMLKDLRDQVLSLMLRPLDSVFSTFPRAVRDVAVRAGKRVKLNIGGQSVEMDQGVAESLVEPLVHLLNNAVAHGIETPEERKAAGKSEEGNITILARQSGNEVRIEIIDDGRGINVDDVKRVAVKRGVTTQVEADAMDSAEILEMIFRPGFSTHKDVDDLAGRGIGMNVVQDAVRKLTGSIRIHTVVGEGTRFILSLPVSIAVQQALTFRMGAQRYGMLTHMIEQAVPLNKQTVEKGPGGKSFLRYGKHQVPIVDLRKMMTVTEDDSKETISSEPYVLISEHIEGFVGIVIDELMSDTEIVVRDLDPYIKRYQPQGLMGNTITPDGSVLLLLEPYGIKEMGRTSPEHEIELNVEESEKLNFKVLLVDDSLIAREVEKGILQSIGFDVDTAIDGMDGLEKLHAGEYDMVITDLEMPRLDGFGFVRRMRNEKQYEEMPIMVISTRESAEDRMRSLDAGADAYLVKQHLNGDDLMSTVQSLVGPLRGSATSDSTESSDAPIV